MPENETCIPSLTLWHAYEHINNRTSDLARVYALTDEPTIKTAFRADWDAGSILLRAHCAVILGEEPNYNA